MLSYIGTKHCQAWAGLVKRWRHVVLFVLNAGYLTSFMQLLVLEFLPQDS